MATQILGCEINEKRNMSLFGCMMAEVGAASVASVASGTDHLALCEREKVADLS